MITKFKIFENKNNYNIGDYIKVYDKDISTDVLNCIKIIDKHPIGNGFKYDVECIITQSYEILKSFLFNNQVERESTPEEIKEFEIIKAAIKYNL